LPVRTGIELEIFSQGRSQAFVPAFVELLDSLAPSLNDRSQSKWHAEKSDNTTPDCSASR
jgi:hypothetical protein